MNKESLRPVAITIPVDYKPWLDKGIAKGVYKGYFHGFFQEGHCEDGIDCMATVEFENGEVITIGAGSIKFLDREDK